MNENREELRRIYKRKENTEGAVYIPAKARASIYDESHLFNACAYCRVSAENNEQLSSFELQREHYENLASNHKNWDLKTIFADEGISGTSLKTENNSSK